MIGDREHDIIGAKKNNIASIGVLFGYGSRKELEEANADYIVNDFEEIKAILKI
jgi:phosphoglycolate phosphatase